MILSIGKKDKIEKEADLILLEMNYEVVTKEDLEHAKEEYSENDVDVVVVSHLGFSMGEKLYDWVKKNFKNEISPFVFINPPKPPQKDKHQYSVTSLNIMEDLMDHIENLMGLPPIIESEKKEKVSGNEMNTLNQANHALEQELTFVKTQLVVVKKELEREKEISKKLKSMFGEASSMIKK